MGKIFLTSDLHFGHDREFVWKVRGYNSVEEMNEAQVRKWNETVSENDSVYILGDFCWNNQQETTSHLVWNS